MNDAEERHVLRRVLDALLREDHLGLSSNGHLVGGEWCTRAGDTQLRLPVRPDGFQHDLCLSRPSFVIERGEGPPVTVVRLETMLEVLGPVDDPVAEAGWAAFVQECRGELEARRLAARRRPLVDAAVSASRAHKPRGMAGALLEDVLAAHADHPVHPTSRSRRGLDDRELLAYAPEHAPTFALGWLPVPRAELTLVGALPPWWPRADAPDTVLVPVHPLTAARLNLPVADAERVLVRPTLSMRTVALADDPSTHLKLPLATATLGARNRRTIAVDSLADGVAMQRLLQRIAAEEPRFAGRILHADESTYAHAGDEIRAFLLRRYPAEVGSSVVVPVAALAAPDPSGTTVAERLVGGNPWPLLAAYLDLLLDWHVYLWLRHGVALEAHQQNVQLVVGPGGDVRLLYKDNDGARLDARHDVVLADRRMSVRDPGELADVFTTITLHLCAAAPLLALARLGVEVPSPAVAVRERLVQAREQWAAGHSGSLLTERVLNAARLPVKAMVTAGTLLPKERIGCTDINKHYLRTGPNYLRESL